MIAADLFCGAGGTSTGLIEAMEMLGHSIDLTAVNHWEKAVDTHKLNHPDSRHFNVSIDELNPRKIFPEGLDILWASPECTHHSNARGGRPMNDQSRATAWCVTRWAEALQPNIILVENVPEFLNWGGLTKEGRPLKAKKGETFRAWVSTLESLGYRVEWKLLCAADYGDPTTRKRLFVQAVRGKRKIVWPNPTHTKRDGDLLETLKPWVGAKECIDFTLPSISIYERKKPLAEKTMERIYAGLKKYGLRNYIVAWDHQSGNGVWSGDTPLSTVTTKARHGVAEPFIVELVKNQDARSIDDPVTTVRTSGAHHALAEPMLLPQQSCGTCKPVSQPVPTVATAGAIGLVEPFLVQANFGGGDHNSRISNLESPLKTVVGSNVHGLAEPYLVSYYGNGKAHDVDQPMPTATTRERFGLVQPVIEIDGKTYLIDIKFRMLQPGELALAQGFRKDYKFAGNKTEIVKQIGNAVPRRLARALALAAISQDNKISELLDSTPNRNL